ncbi:hypothetical protein [Effusibacillus pohliae]|uniref:hypothetical protein n=1 Tax=Effusibacillus pohliae TaxID=232270 RepID=UPI0003689A6F|nr:hypothetical protein [Effusibacillus pohliae]
MSWLSDVMERKKLEEKLFASDWFKGLMENEEFRTSYEKKYSVRLRLADTKYLKELLESERARMDFVNKVLRSGEEQEK